LGAVVHGEKLYCVLKSREYPRLLGNEKKIFLFQASRVRRSNLEEAISIAERPT